MSDRRNDSELRGPISAGTPAAPAKHHAILPNKNHHPQRLKS